MRDRPRVLVLDGEQRKSLAVVRALGDDCETWTAATSRPALAAWSRFSDRFLEYRFDSDFPKWLVDTATANRIDFVVCTQEQTMVRACAVHEKLSAAGVRPTFPPLDILRQALDKTETLRIGNQVGIEAPKTTVLESWDEAEAAAEDIGYPIVLKPRHSYFWNGERFVPGGGAFYAADGRQLTGIVDRLAAELPPPLIQEFVPGEGVGVFLLLDQAGDLVAEFAHQRIRDIRPTGSGSVLRKSIGIDPHLRDLSLSLLNGMKWWGVAMVEFRSDERTGRKLLMEVNGRFWGSLQLAIDAGVNFPRLLIEVAGGAKVPRPTYEEDVHVRWWMGDLVRTFRVLRGRPSGYPGSFPNRWSGLRDLLGPQPPGTRNEVLRRSDPRPAMAEALAAIKRAI